MKKIFIRLVSIGILLSIISCEVSQVTKTENFRVKGYRRNMQFQVAETRYVL